MTADSGSMKGKRYYGKLRVKNLITGEESVWETAERYIRLEGDAVIIYRTDTRTTNILPLSKYKISITEGSEDGCVVSTAALIAQGKPDDCGELQILRKWRDEFVLYQPQGKELINKYYALAPLVVGVIKTLNPEEQQVVFREVYEQMVKGTISLLQAGKPYEAAVRYWKYFENLLNEWLR